MLRDDFVFDVFQPFSRTESTGGRSGGLPSGGSNLVAVLPLLASVFSTVSSVACVSEACVACVRGVQGVGDAGEAVSDRRSLYELYPFFAG